MKSLISHKTLTVLSSLSIVTISEANAPYFVRPGDNLSKILFTQNYSPIYGSKGFLKQTIALNPQLKKSGGNLIFPNSQITLPPKNNSDAQVSPTPALVSSPSTETPQRAISQNSQGPAVKSRSTFGANVHTQFIRLDASPKSGPSATLLSNPTFGVGGSWKQHWSSTLHSFIEFDLTKVSFRQTREVNRSIDDRHQTLFGTRLGLTRDFTERFALTFDGTYREVPLTRATSATTAIVEKFDLPQVGTLGTFQIYHINDLRLFGGGGVRLNLPSQQRPYSSNLSTEKMLYFGVSDRISDVNLAFDTSYSQNSITASKANFEITTIGFQLRATKDF